MADIRTFNRQISEWHDRVAMPAAAKMQRDVLTDSINGLIDVNPVGDPRLWKRPPPPGYVGGHSKRNWRIYLHRSYDAAERPGVDPTGAIAKAEAAAVIGRIANKPVQFASIQNPLPYMEPLANGWSRQAPAGWMERVIAQVTANYGRVR